MEQDGFLLQGFGRRSEIQLTIEIDLDEYGYRWDRTDEDDIVEWLEDIYEYAQGLQAGPRRTPPQNSGPPLRHGYPREWVLKTYQKN
ncbi:hypothetical protein [Koleobacter methoxysyntrophicus]|uniref:hypothetical protein n=1 Tax=Koleobacter methoxysyntrophicus TaxID=2751313 RepID=UPI0019D5917D|nr:hypothetical protein [Koleobacter methoxysyntrophicus]